MGKQDEEKRIGTCPRCFKDISSYLRYYNYKRMHSSINYLTPAEVYFNK